MSIDVSMPAQPEDESQKKDRGDGGFDVGVDGIATLVRGVTAPQAPAGAGATAATETAAAGIEAATGAGVEATTAAGAEAAAVAGEAAGGVAEGVGSVIGGILEGL